LLGRESPRLYQPEQLSIGVLPCHFVEYVVAQAAVLELDRAGFEVFKMFEQPGFDERQLRFGDTLLVQSQTDAAVGDDGIWMRPGLADLRFGEAQLP